MFGSSDAWKRWEDEKKAYDEQWERERARDDAPAAYKPPKSPGMFGSADAWKRYEGEKKAYDEQWDREKAKQDYRR
jgi:hypothetical protein